MTLKENDPKKLPHVVIWTDGSALGNPGPGGYGAVMLFVDARGETHRLELTQGYARTTNNRMELMAVIVALEALKFSCSVELHSDSRYVINAFEQKWVESWAAHGWKTAAKKPVKNIDLWKRVLSRVHHLIYFFSGSINCSMLQSSACARRKTVRACALLISFCRCSYC